MLFDRVEHHNVDNKGVNIHYVTVGQGPVLLFVHGAPDFWYLWNNQMDAMCDNYQCVAMDTRGYNHSGKPEGVENYSMDYLMSDITAVINDVGAEKVTVIGHDFGGLISWYFAMDPKHRAKVERLIVINITHPQGFSRTLANATPEQAKHTEYARFFVNPEHEEKAIKMVGAFIQKRMDDWWNDKDPRVVEFVQAAYNRADPKGLINFYRANYFKQPYKEQTGFPPVEAPVLQIQGLADLAVYKDGLSNTWDWVNADYTLVTYPGAGHIPQLEIPEKVTKAIRSWLLVH